MGRGVSALGATRVGLCGVEGCRGRVTSKKEIPWLASLASVAACLLSIVSAVQRAASSIGYMMA
jgi:hypothetical protein